MLVSTGKRLRAVDKQGWQRLATTTAHFWGHMCCTVQQCGDLLLPYLVLQQQGLVMQACLLLIRRTCNLQLCALPGVAAAGLGEAGGVAGAKGGAGAAATWMGPPAAAGVGAAGVAVGDACGGTEGLAPLACLLLPGM